LREALITVLRQIRQRYPRVPHDLIEDSLADAALAWVSRPGRTASADRTRAVLYSAARRSLVRRIRRRLRESPYTETDDLLPAVPPREPTIEDDVLVREVLRGVRETPTTNRTKEIILLSAAGEAIKDIANLLALKAVTVRKKLFRGLRKTRVFLGASGNPRDPTDR
jgi:DNA-directed RNA polymerase specialized sigma24 family protein